MYALGCFSKVTDNNTSYTLNVFISVQTNSYLGFTDLTDMRTCKNSAYCSICYNTHKKSSHCKLFSWGHLRPQIVKQKLGLIKFFSSSKKIIFQPHLLDESFSFLRHLKNISYKLTTQELVFWFLAQPSFFLLPISTASVRSETLRFLSFR